MTASSLSLGFATAAAITTCSSSSSTPSSSSIEYLSFFSGIHFPFKARTLVKYTLKLKPHQDLVKFAPFPRSLFVCDSAGFDGFEATQTQRTDEATQTQRTELLEEEPAPLDEERKEDAEEENNGAYVPQSTESRRLYVGNLPYSFTSSQLADVFSESGHVASVEIVYDRMTDRSRGFAFVTMGSFEEAKEAIRLFDGSQVGGRTVKVNFPEVPRGGEREVMEPKIRSSYQAFVDSPHKIYAGNLSWALTSQGLREAFQDQPGFLSAKVIYDRETGRSRGFGFVSFASSEEADSALGAVNGVELEGRPLRLNLAQQRSSLSPPPVLETNTESES